MKTSGSCSRNSSCMFWQVCKMTAVRTFTDDAGKKGNLSSIIIELFILDQLRLCFRLSILKITI